MCSREDLIKRILPHKHYVRRQIGFKVFTQRFGEVTGVYHKTKYEFGKVYSSKRLSKYERNGMSTDLKVFGFCVFKNRQDAIDWGRTHCYYSMIIKVSYNDVMAIMKNNVVLVENMKLLKLMRAKEWES